MESWKANNVMKMSVSFEQVTTAFYPSLLHVQHVAKGTHQFLHEYTVDMHGNCMHTSDVSLKQTSLTVAYNLFPFTY